MALFVPAERLFAVDTLEEALLRLGASAEDAFEADRTSSVMQGLVSAESFSADVGPPHFLEHDAAGNWNGWLAHLDDASGDQPLIEGVVASLNQLATSDHGTRWRTLQYTPPAPRVPTTPLTERTSHG